MNKENYLTEVYSQLKNPKYYRRLEAPLYTNNSLQIKQILNQMTEDEFISEKQYRYLSGPNNIKPRYFYLLPKIHKEPHTWPQPNKMPSGRPIISDVDSETDRISEYIDSFLNPLSTKHPSYVKNTYDFIDKITKFPILENYILVTGDITALYTNMNLERSLKIVQETFDNNPDPRRPDHHILKLLTIILTKNDFEFGGNFYLQIFGTAMGKRISPALANLYLTEFDQKAMQEFKIRPSCFYRYLDDIFFLFPKSQEHELSHFEIFLNSLIPDIKITLNYSYTNINFLDVTICLNNLQLHTKTFFKETDTHQLLHKTSHHPSHTFKGLIKSQLIRFKRLSTFKSDYLKTCQTLFSFLKIRGYTYTELNKEKHKIWHTYLKTNQQNTNDEHKLIPIIIDHTAISKELGITYRDILTTQKTLKNIRPIIAYRNSKNLGQLLIRNRFTKTRNGYFSPCSDHKCKTCLHHTTFTQTFSSHRTKQIFDIQQQLTCTTTNVIYLITCRHCHLQYVGETSRSIRERLSNHKSDIKNKKETSISNHFNSHLHTILDLRITAIQHCTQDTTFRLKQEKFWQNTLKTLQPLGINGNKDKKN